MSLATAIDNGIKDRLMQAVPGWSMEQVPAQHAAVPWRRCWDLLSRAVDRFPNMRDKWTSREAFHAVIEKRAQLWIAWNFSARRIDGAVFTRLLDKPALAPEAKVCEIVLCAGDDFREWGPGMFAVLRAWAGVEGCNLLACYGRRGWKRWFGFREVGASPEGVPLLVMAVE